MPVDYLITYGNYLTKSYILVIEVFSRDHQF